MALTAEQEKQVRHLVAHAARILLQKAAHPEVHTAEHDEQMEIYRARWATVPAEDRARIPAELIADTQLGDLTQESITAALTALGA